MYIKQWLPIFVMHYNFNFYISIVKVKYRLDQNHLKMMCIIVGADIRASVQSCTEEANYNKAYATLFAPSWKNK